VSELVQQIINGLSLGSIYALIALGYTMVYGILKLINFAHGEVFMMGAYAGFFTATSLGVERYEASGTAFPLYLALLVLAIAMGASALLGVTIEALAYRPVRSAPRLTPLITAIGVSLFLQNVAMLAFDAKPRRYPAILRDAIAATKGFEGVSGTISIDAGRNAEKSAVVIKITGGQGKYETTVAP
jgi:branched-chain amino acid transport system permease protein